MFKFKNPLDYSVSEEPEQRRNPYTAQWPNSNLPNMQAQNPYTNPIQSRHSAFESAYRRNRQYNAMQEQTPYNLGQQNPYLQRNPYNANNAHLFDSFNRLNPNANIQRQHLNQYEDPRTRLQGQHLRGLDEYGLLDGHTKDEMVSENEGWDFNDLPRPVDHYRDILPTMQYKPDPMPNPESDEIQF